MVGTRPPKSVSSLASSSCHAPSKSISRARASSLSSSFTCYDDDPLREFVEVMCGNSSNSTIHTDVFRIVELENLTAHDLLSYLKKNDVESHGFLKILRAVLVDLLKRRRRLTYVTNLFASTSRLAHPLHLHDFLHNEHDEELLPSILFDCADRDLLIALLSTSSIPDRRKIFSFASKLDIPLPIVHRWVDGNDSVETLTHFNELVDVLPLDSNAALLWLGTNSCTGKSSLLGELFCKGESVSTRTSTVPPTHFSSIDLFSSTSSNGNGVTLIDVHGYGSGEDFVSAVSTLASVASLVVVQVSQLDFEVVEVEGDGIIFSSDVGPSEELAKVLQNVSSCRNVAVLLRDVGADMERIEFVPAMWDCVKSMLGDRLVGFWTIDDLRDFSTIRRRRVVDSLRVRIDSALENSFPFPSSQRLSALYNMKFGNISEDVSENSSLGVKLFKVLEDDHVDGKLCSLIFPATQIGNAMAKLQARDRELSKKEAHNQENGLVSNLENEFARLAKEKHQLEQQKKEILHKKPARTVQFFLTCILHSFSDTNQEGTTVVTPNSLSKYFDAWKEPKCGHLLTARRRLLDLLSFVGDKNSNIQQELAEIDSQLDELDISVDSIWLEIMAVCDILTQYFDTTTECEYFSCIPNLSVSNLQRVFQDWIFNQGYPMQFLRGNPLQVAGNFLVDVLRQISVECGNRELLVISIIGAQSSAKSTLLNYLFGCGFATRAGRCTQGLYCSLMEASDGRLLLILDSEGLMSIDANRDHVFDAQLVLFAMACSHVVLINHKGEMSRTLQDMLEVCLFAMNSLQVCKLKPKLCFVLRDQHDRSKNIHQDALRLMRCHLADATSRLGLDTNSSLQVSADAVYLLPSAFASDLRDNEERTWSTEIFGNEVFTLRQSIFALTKNSSTEDSDDSFKTLHSWYLHAVSVWNVLEQYGSNLLHYKSIQEVELRKELEEIMKVVVKNTLEGEEGFNSKSCQLVERYANLIEQEFGEDIDTNFQQALQTLRDQYVTSLKECFKKQATACKASIPKSLLQEFDKKLLVDLDRATELCKYTWSLRFNVLTNELHLRQLQVHFKTAIENLLQRQRESSSSILTENTVEELFETEWEKYDLPFQKRLFESKKSSTKLSEEVTVLFNHLIRQSSHESPFNVLEQFSSSKFTKTSIFNGSMVSELLEITDEKIVNAIPKGVTGIGEIVSNAFSDLTNNLVVTASTTGQLTQRHIRDTLLSCDTQVRAVEKNILPTLGVALVSSGRVPLLNIIQNHLRVSLLHALLDHEERWVQKQMDALSGFKELMQEEFHSILLAKRGDVDRACMFAERYLQSIESYVDTILLKFAAGIRVGVLEDMPNASSVSERAWLQTFEERNWMEVLEYVLDVNRYIHKVMKDLFDSRKRTLVRTKRDRLVANAEHLLDEMVIGITSWAGIPHRRIDSLLSYQKYLQEKCNKRHQADGDGGSEITDVLVQRFPVLPDFQIQDTTIFAECFCRRVAEWRDEKNVVEWLDNLIEDCCQDQQEQVWEQIKGCDATCPLCGSKCTEMGSHTTHSCSHHLLPAFNGWRNAKSKEATLELCTSKANRKAAKRSDDGKTIYKDLEEYLRKEHPEWWPFPMDSGSSVSDAVLKAAWVNCRAPLLKRYGMKDSTPPDWIAAYYEPDRALPDNAVELLIQSGIFTDDPSSTD